jgi:hypothetical protein
MELVAIAICWKQWWIREIEEEFVPVSLLQRENLLDFIDEEWFAETVISIGWYCRNDVGKIYPITRELMLALYKPFCKAYFGLFEGTLFKAKIPFKKTKISLTWTQMEILLVY